MVVNVVRDLPHKSMWGLFLVASVCVHIVLVGASTSSVVHMVFDDFRPDLPFYGQKFVHAPNLNAFAEKSVVFDRAYCQIAVCSPSRNSFMTGRRPNTTLVWNFFNSFREAQCPDSRKEILLGTVLRTWEGKDPQMTGGIGGCCTSCFGEKDCVGWSYNGTAGTAGGQCTLLSEVSTRTPCPEGLDRDGHVLPCMSGGRGHIPKFTSLPQHFRNNGFLTYGVGKLYHDGGYGFGANTSSNPEGPGTPPLADPLSWTNNAIQYPSCSWNDNNAACSGLPKFENSYPPNALQNKSAYIVPAGQGSCTGVPDGPYGNLHNQYCTEDIPNTGFGPDPDGGIHGRPPLLDVPVFLDARVKLEAAVDNQKNTGQRFFLAVGIKRPHLCWRVPQGIVDQYYNPSNFTPPLPQQATLDKSIDPVAWVPFYTQNPYEALPSNTTQELRRHYYSAITWADHCAGQVFDKLTDLGVWNNTIVIVHADHGWHLGEYNMWEKRTIWELGTRVPFLVHVPWLPQSYGKRASAPVELIDVYPTLVDLAGLLPPANDTFPLEGISLRSLLENPSLETLAERPYALSTYPRCPSEKSPYNTECIHNVERSAFPFMGYTIRTTQYRYTEFVKWNGSSLSPDWDNVHSRELYDHREDIPGTPQWEAKDDFEDKNHISLVDPNVVLELSQLLRAAFGSGGRPQLDDALV